MFFPYVRPQECGTRTEIRWMTLADEDGNGLLITAMPLFSASALPYTTSQLDYADSRFRHPADLQENDFIDVNVDLRQMGVGGDDSWGAKPMKQYLLPSGTYSFTFAVRAIRHGDDPMALSKRKVAPPK
jgi:beta-galactosidase